MRVTEITTATTKRTVGKTRQSFFFCVYVDGVDYQSSSMCMMATSTASMMNCVRD